MAFSWEARTPEGKLGREQIRGRKARYSMEELSADYENEADGVLKNPENEVARGEIARFSKKILSTEGQERKEYLENLTRSLNAHTPQVFSRIPDDEHERPAFALALARRHVATLQ